MAETTNQHIFTFQELLTLMVKARDIHEGLWGLHVKFGLQAANVKAGPTPDEALLLPTALLPLLEMGISPVKELHDLAVDAAKVNPAPKKRKARVKTS